MMTSANRSVGVWALLAVLIVGCGSNDDPATPPPPPGAWLRTQAGDAFSMYLPPNLQQIPRSGTDSFVGEYRSAEMVVSFDYGWYSSPLDGHPDSRDEASTIDGRACRIVWWEYEVQLDDLRYVVGVHFPDVGDDENGLTLWALCRDEERRIDGERVIRSIDFPEKH